MKNPRSISRNSGFTLVELAVVLLIIGLIVGGILRGQELISSARVNSVQTDVTQIRTAVRTFQDKFVALPGDLSNPGELINADFTFSGDGNGDRRIAKNRSDANRLDAESEPVQAWVHLGASGLLEEIDADELNGYALNANNAMASSVGGFYSLGQGLGRPSGPDIDFQHRDADWDASIPVPQSEIWVMLGTKEDSRAANDRPAMSASQAAQLDRKTDDGDPSSGNMRGDWFNADQSESGCMDKDVDKPDTNYNAGQGRCAIGMKL